MPGTPIEEKATSGLSQIRPGPQPLRIQIDASLKEIIPEIEACLVQDVETVDCYRVIALYDAIESHIRCDSDTGYPKSLRVRRQNYRKYELQGRLQGGLILKLFSRFSYLTKEEFRFFYSYAVQYYPDSIPKAFVKWIGVFLNLISSKKSYKNAYRDIPMLDAFFDICSFGLSQWSKWEVQEGFDTYKTHYVNRIIAVYFDSKKIQDRQEALQHIVYMIEKRSSTLPKLLEVLGHGCRVVTNRQGRPAWTSASLKDFVGLFIENTSDAQCMALYATVLESPFTYEGSTFAFFSQDAEKCKRVVDFTLQVIGQKSSLTTLLLKNISDTEETLKKCASIFVCHATEAQCFIFCIFLLEAPQISKYFINNRIGVDTLVLKNRWVDSRNRMGAELCQLIYRARKHAESLPRGHQLERAIELFFQTNDIDISDHDKLKCFLMHYPAQAQRIFGKKTRLFSTNPFSDYPEDVIQMAMDGEEMLREAILQHRGIAVLIFEESPCTHLVQDKKGILKNKELLKREERILKRYHEHEAQKEKDRFGLDFTPVVKKSLEYRRLEYDLISNAEEGKKKNEEIEYQKQRIFWAFVSLLHAHFDFVRQVKEKYTIKESDRTRDCLQAYEQYAQKRLLDKQQVHTKTSVEKQPVASLIPSPHPPGQPTAEDSKEAPKKATPREDKSSRTYWYSDIDGYRLMIDLRKCLFEERREPPALGGEPYSSVRYNPKRVFVSDPYQISSFCGQFASDVDAITGQAPYGNWRWEELPRVLVISFCAYAHWRVIRVEVDYYSSEVSVLWDDPYGGDVYEGEAFKGIRNRLLPVLKAELSRLIHQWYVDKRKVLPNIREEALEIWDERYKSLMQQTNSYDCGPIAFQNVRDYADVAKSNREFVSDSKDAVYTILAASTDNAYKEAIAKRREDDKEIWRAWEEKPNTEEEQGYKQRKLKGLAAGVKESPELASIMGKISELSPEQVDEVFDLLDRMREEKGGEEPIEVSLLEEVYRAVEVKPSLDEVSKFLEEKTEDTLLGLPESKDVMTEIKDDRDLHEYAQTFYKKMTSIYHGHSALYSRVVAVSDVPGEVAEVTGEGAALIHAGAKGLLHALPLTLGVEKLCLYGEWRYMKGKANKVTDFFSDIGITPLEAITEMTLGFTLAFKEEIRAAGKKVKGWVKQVWHGVVEWGLFGSDIDTPTKELACAHCHWVINKGMPEVKVYRGIKTLEIFLDRQRKSLPQEMRERTLVPNGFQESVVKIVQQLSRIERGVARIEVTVTATHGELREVRAEVRSSTAQMHTMLKQMSGKQQAKIDNLEEVIKEKDKAIKILKKSNKNKDAQLAQQQAKIAKLEKDKNELERQLAQAQAAEESKEEDPSQEDTENRKSSPGGP